MNDNLEDIDFVRADEIDDSAVRNPLPHVYLQQSEFVLGSV